MNNLLFQITTNKRRNHVCLQKKIMVMIIVVLLITSASCAHKEKNIVSTNDMTTGFYFDRDGDPVIYNGTCEKIGLSIKAESASDEGVTLIFSYDKNDAIGAGEIISGERYLIEKKLADEWIPIDYSTNTVPEWIDTGWTIMNGESYTVIWTDIYGKLDPGMYRIIKPVKCNHKIGDYKTFYIAAEFFFNE